MKTLIVFIILTGFFSCSQNPDPAVSYLIDSGNQGQRGDNDGQSDFSLYYKGNDFFGASCDLSFTPIEKGQLQWKAELNYLLHGSELPSTTIIFNENKNSFIGILLTNNQQGQVESLDDYINSGELRFYIEIQLKTEFQLSEFTRVLDLIAEGENSLDETLLDQIDRIVFRAKHIGHYDAGGCLNYSFNGVLKE